METDLKSIETFKIIAAVTHNSHRVKSDLLLLFYLVKFRRGWLVVCLFLQKQVLLTEQKNNVKKGRKQF